MGLWAITEIIYEDFHRGAGDAIIGELPPIAQLHADERSTTVFAPRFVVIAKRIAEGLRIIGSIATGMADEMAFRLMITGLRVQKTHPCRVQRRFRFGE